MSVKHIEVKGTIVNGTAAPTLDQLKNGDCAKKQLQAALVQLIDIVNKNEEQSRLWTAKIEQELAKKEPRVVRYGRGS